MEKVVEFPSQPCLGCGLDRRELGTNTLPKRDEWLCTKCIIYDSGHTNPRVRNLRWEYLDRYRS